MKIRYLLLFLLPITAAVALQGCLKDKCTTTRNFIRFDPIYKSVAECRADFGLEAPHALQNPGKIYVFDHYLLVNEFQEGIHVYDNADPTNPTPIAFWRIPGNVDMAIRGHYLYVDQYMDLLTIDIANLEAPQQVCRRENEFSLFGFDPYLGYITGYTETNVTEEVDCNGGNSNWFFRGRSIMFDQAFAAETTLGGAGNNSALIQSGIAGSYSRFGLYDEYLYTVDQQNLRSYSLNNPVCPERLDLMQIGWNIETIFPWKNKLFVGSQNGVFIFDNSNPAHPTLENVFSHATGCDPVVCDDKYAYVTIHDGTTCGGTVNQLDVIGIEFLPQTSLLAQFPMTRPMGLTFDGNELYVCDAGLKVFDKTDPLHLQQIAHLQNIDAYDVIATGNDRLIVVGPGGFYQFDISDPKNPKELSKIAI